MTHTDDVSTHRAAADSTLSDLQVDRRTLNRLLVAATGGLLAGVAGGCGKAESEGGEAVDEAHLMAEPHVCRGLNTCKGLGQGGANACAGQGACASVAAHGCRGSNDCAGQGGCRSTAGRNGCKGQGECGVPLQHGVWEPTRAAFETAMKAGGKEFGSAPAGE